MCHALSHFNGAYILRAFHHSITSLVKLDVKLASEIPRTFEQPLDIDTLVSMSIQTVAA